MNSEDKLKEFNLYVMRTHFQVRAKQKILGNELYMQKQKKDLDLYKHAGCEKLEEPEVKDVEKYKIVLLTEHPTLQDLYSKIREHFPEFTSKKNFHLYWKYSATKILPISNLLTYLSMISLIAHNNNNLYLIARDWDETWLNDTVATYVSHPEDVVLVNMVAPKQSIFTITQDEDVYIVRAAAVTEFTRTYNPPQREVRKFSSKGKPKKSEVSKTKKKK